MCDVCVGWMYVVGMYHCLASLVSRPDGELPAAAAASGNAANSKAAPRLTLFLFILPHQIRFPP